MNIIIARLLPYLTLNRVLFIAFTWTITICITEIINKKYLISQGRFFKPKESWIYLFVLSSLMSLIIIK